MAGSLNHIVAEDGTFTMDTIETMRDAHMALEECHQIIALLLHTAYRPGRRKQMNAICRALAYPTPKTFPVIQPELHGAESAWRS